MHGLQSFKITVSEIVVVVFLSQVLVYAGGGGVQP